MTLKQCSYERITLLKQIWESGCWGMVGLIHPLKTVKIVHIYGLAKWRNYPCSRFQSTCLASANFLPLPRFLTNIP